MLELISRYEYGMKARLYELVNHLLEHDMIDGTRPDYVHDLGDVTTLPPILAELASPEDEAAPAEE